jgi:acetyl esterase/lipase
MYRALLLGAEEEGHRVIMAGDSSGANIVLSVVLEALREDEEVQDLSIEEEKHISHPTAVMVISPSTDLTRSNPEIENLQHLDPMLTPKFVRDTAKAWLGEWEATDRRVSPINADISLLATAGVKVHGVTGGYDILAPDAVMFRNKCEEAEVEGEWLEWEKQMHCFVLTWPYGLREGRESVGWMLEVLKKE